eukprot:12180116-Ditylum_brightwellii.AAC.1
MPRLLRKAVIGEARIPFKCCDPYLRVIRSKPIECGWILLCGVDLEFVCMLNLCMDNNSITGNTCNHPPWEMAAVYLPHISAHAHSTRHL